MKQLIFIILLSISQGISAEPSVSIKTDYYNVKDSMPNSIRKDMNKKRSGKYDDLILLSKDEIFQSYQANYHWI